MMKMRSIYKGSGDIPSKQISQKFRMGRDSIIVRRDSDGGYQIISGYRRKRACEIAEIRTVPAYIVDLSDDEATILMADVTMYHIKSLYRQCLTQSSIYMSGGRSFYARESV
jgi:hypothetical protein